MLRSKSLVVFAALMLWAASASWAQRGLLRVTVVDPDGTPIPGVEVTVTSPEQASYRKTLTTDDDGKFSLRFLPNQAKQQFEMLFEKPGYEAFIQPIAPASTQAMTEEFVMNRAQGQAAAQDFGDLSSVLTGADNAAIVAFNAGLDAQRNGDLDVAQAQFEEALAADASLGPAQVALAQVLLDQGRSAEALTAADRALELAASRADALQVKYQALKALGRGSEAEAVSALLDAAQDDAAAALRIYNEGGTAFQAGDNAAALEQFQRAATLDPTLREAHHAVATLLLAQGDAEGAAASAEKALSVGSDDVATLRVLYDAYQALGKTEELTSIAPRLAAVDPEFGGAKLVEQAAELWNGGQTEGAVALSRQALAIDPSLAKAHYFLGLDHLSGGRNAEAKASLGRFLELAPDDSDAATAREMLTYIE
ncbi:MAG: tetratricopeptide repeat protein [Acidobacteriota bacterium]